MIIIIIIIKKEEGDDDDDDNNNNNNDNNNNNNNYINKVTCNSLPLTIQRSRSVTGPKITSNHYSLLLITFEIDLD